MLIEHLKLDNQAKLIELETYNRSLIPTAVFGVSEPFKHFLSATLYKKMVYIAKDSLTAKRAKESLESYLGKGVTYLPAKDDVLLYKSAFDKTALYKRIEAIGEILEGATVITTTFEALLQLFPKKIENLKIYSAREYPLDRLKNQLILMGYSRREFVEDKGEFAIRGDILEVYPVNSDTAFRCDFFGDEIEKIRLYDVYEKKSGEEVRSFNLLSSRDFELDEDRASSLKKEIFSAYKRLKPSPFLNKSRALYDKLCETLDSDLSSQSLAFLLPLIDHAEKGLFDFIGRDWTIVFDECKLVGDNLNHLIKEHTERTLSLVNAGQAFDFTIRQYYDFNLILDEIKKHSLVSLQTLTTQVSLFNVLKTIRVNCGTLSRYALKNQELINDVKNWVKSAYKVVICCGNPERADKLAISLAENKIIARQTNSPKADPGVYVLNDYLPNGFVFHDAKLVVIGTADIYVSVKERKIKHRRNDAFTAPQVGDFAVHEHHGIGVVRGTERISTTEGTKDYVTLEYFGGDLLHVPVDRLDRLTKYLGGEKTPRLSRLGGVEFERIKQRVRESIARMSIDLKKLYKDRASKLGFVFSEDNELSREFDEAFEFNETEDQIQSIAEIKRDMQSSKVMDRLLCGDVGFGKTEVALRAIFKAVMDGKQVAFVAPTTILTEQHYQTCIKRFKDFGVRVAVLNRFISPLKVKNTIKAIAEGDVDVVIGTHKLFSSEIKFKDLGLLVLDEEHCFGVEHKEKLRVLKNNVDTLTMTATPIPRTLHMSLSGIRDISLINTPPEKRIPVQSYVLEESDELIRDAIVREKGRGGQVFLLFNKVEQIYSFAERIKKILPADYKLCVAHGQMPKKMLEDAVMSFYRGEYDVLVCTTIIENGIDLPSANTLIVIDADKLGLFTLYQLKGRVGRSDKMAHAYFTYKPDKVLNDTAYKRLSALMEYTELGSGYKIAMRDLEIRGAGNVLGKEQHGHMDKIGYELYSKLLREEMGEIQREKEIEIDIRMDSFIPENYIESGSSRLDVYKIISEISSREEGERVIKNIEENYGKAPQEVINLVDIAVFKFVAKKANVVEAVLTSKRAFIAFEKLNDVYGGIQDALEEFNENATLSFSDRPEISFEGGKTRRDILGIMTNFLVFSLKK